MSRMIDSHRLNRRAFLATTVTLAGTYAARGSLAAQGAAAPASQASRAPRRRALRVAHLTDIHLQPERDAEAGLAACLARVNGLDPKPDLVLTGGDSVMDVFEASKARATDLRTLFSTTFPKHCSIPVKHAIGNHDIFGWARRHLDAGAPAHGKQYAVDLFGLPRRYYSFDMGGWHFIVLDSVQPATNDGKESYVAYCDDEQTEWLTKDLAARPAGSPTLVLSHIPVLSLTSITYGKHRGRQTVGTDTIIDSASMHTDGHALHVLLKEHGVRLCLSGHQHLLDHCTTDGVSYICDGAVSGAWWRGKHQGLDEGFGVVDLYDDGTFDHSYLTYGWSARASLDDRVQRIIAG